MTSFAPFTASKVRSISSGRHWVSTWIATPSGMAPPSMIERTKSKSVCEAEGKATSISLKPMLGEQPEHAVLALDAHRLDQRLIAVAQIDGAPDRRLVDDARGPLAIGQDDRLEGAIFGNRHFGGILECWRS